MTTDSHGGNVKATCDARGSDGITVMLLESVGSMLGANAAMDNRCSGIDILGKTTMSCEQTLLCACPATRSIMPLLT